MNNSVVLHCQNLTKVYHDGVLNVEVFSDVNLTVKAGERVAIVGASGAGKSTLLHLLSGLDQPTTGQVFIAERDIASLKEPQRSQWRNQHLGFVYQFHHLLPEFTVLENVCIPLLLRDVEVKQAADKASELLNKVGLGNRLQHKLAELSGGERQRTAIVRALVSNPLCVLADEPTGNLDNRTAEKVYEMMLELNRELNTSIVIVTHDMNLASRMDRILQLANGVLQEMPGK